MNALLSNGSSKPASLPRQMFRNVSSDAHNAAMRPISTRYSSGIGQPEKFILRIFWFRMSKQCGTASFNSEDGFLVTKKHGVRDGTQVRLVTSAGLIRSEERRV